MIKADLSYSKYLLIAGICLIFFTFFGKKSKEDHKYIRNYDEIKESGVLKVATEYNSTSFYVDGDTLAGFHYSLIHAFAKSKNLEVEIVPVMGFDERLKGLNQGIYDVIAYNMPITTVLKDSISFTIPILLDKQVLVQRHNTAKNDSTYIDSQLKLAGQTIHIVKGSPSRLRIENMGNEIGDTIYISEVDKYGPEQLIAMVAHGDIDYVVCEKEIVDALIDSFPNIDAKTEIGFPQFHGWAVNKQSTELLDSINHWLTNYKKTKEFTSLYKKHY